MTVLVDIKDLIGLSILGLILIAVAGYLFVDWIKSKFRK
jgi:hypothetical protein